MKQSYLWFLNGDFHNKILEANLQGQKEKLLTDAMALYYGKFRSIWMKLVDPKSEKFDYLQETFSYIIRG
jgi:hypothetical protein